MEVVCIGSGNAFNQDGRASQALLLRWAPGDATLVDVGPTTLLRWPEEIAFSELSGVCFTHLHGDHIAGWPFLLLQLRLLERRERPLPVVGPHGTGRTLAALVDLCYGELLEQPSFPLLHRELEIAARDYPLDDGRKLTTLPVRHHPSSLGLRFEEDGATIAVSGDTEWCDGLERLCSEVDLAIVECTSVEPAAGHHLSLHELRERRERLGAARILLVHLNDAVATDLARDPIDGVTAGYDGLRYRL